jgi:hypothetical protein
MNEPSFVISVLSAPGRGTVSEGFGTSTIWLVWPWSAVMTMSVSGCVFAKSRPTLIA